MIFQEPMTSLNPVFSIGNQIEESLILHEGLNRRDARLRAIELLRLVDIPAPEKRISEYPHQMSGGMRQRVAIAIESNIVDVQVAGGLTYLRDVVAVVTLDGYP